MQCLIIAAGRGSRIARLGKAKPLVNVRGLPLIQRVMRRAVRGGVNEFLVVTGFNDALLRSRVREIAGKDKLAVDFIYNPDWDKANGLSVLRAENKMREPFCLTMCDHLFDPQILRILRSVNLGRKEVVLAADFRIHHNPLVDMNDVTRVLSRKGKIIDIGKNLKKFNAFDTGFFCCTNALFAGLRRSCAAGDYSLSGGIRQLANLGMALTADIGTCFWLDVDDESALDKAERILARSEE